MKNKSIFTALPLFCFTIFFGMTADLTGRWIVLDFTIRSGPIHLKLLKNK